MAFKLRERVFELLKEVPGKEWAPQDLAKELANRYPDECQAKLDRSAALETQDELVQQLAREIFGSRRRWEAGYATLRSAGKNPVRLRWQNGSAGMPVAEDVEQTKIALNQILFGPPGTGKTYQIVEAALEVLDPTFLANQVRESGTDAELRGKLKKRFDELEAEGRICFTTFHQSFSYEDFVEGLRAVVDDSGQVQYNVEPGVFKRLCDQARTSGAVLGVGVRSNPRIWKISINGTFGSTELGYCLAHGEARIGWGRTGDLRQEERNEYYKERGSNDQNTLNAFSREIAPGDILVCIHSAEDISAVGVVSGEYRFEATVPSPLRSDYQHVLPVTWLYKDLHLPIAPLNGERSFTQKTVYPLDRFTWGDLLSYLDSKGAKPVKPMGTAEQPRLPYVLLIDEINRGNVARIFGELITLIEPSKREGAPEALSVQLPYSKKPFSVPDNVYMIGTMNTADRSLAAMDIALRRRFSFVEMPPRAELLEGLEVEGVSIELLLTTLNRRVEALLDRDHCLGHAYFMPLWGDTRIERLAMIFRQQILPLLQEYFFEDWQRIHWVLNDHRKNDAEDRFLQECPADIDELFGEGVSVGRRTSQWIINDEAFDRIEAYLGVIDHKAAAESHAAVHEVLYEDWLVRKLVSGSIEVKINGAPVGSTMRALRDIAARLAVPLHYAGGGKLNTRALGQRIIQEIEARR
ncbi:AAA family ATPase [Cupriavidus basilensis]|uniref:AAA family ATPase n=1 Tax=Cupriavidus basilensis TaxID=68895 RepID=UPI0020A670C0|nr:AAA family ATPase [Cupriavidus basilensis]MCP3020345.1 AAA family ATPase [Cupriavidus basilensis]